MTESREARAKRLQAARNHRAYIKRTLKAGGMVAQSVDVSARVVEVFALAGWLRPEALYRPLVEAFARVEARNNALLADPYASARDLRDSWETVYRAAASIGLSSAEKRLSKNKSTPPETDEAKTRLLADATFGRIIRTEVEGFADGDAHRICPICRRVKGTLAK